MMTVDLATTLESRLTMSSLTMTYYVIPYNDRRIMRRLRLHNPPLFIERKRHVYVCEPGTAYGLLPIQNGRIAILDSHACFR